MTPMIDTITGPGGKPAPIPSCMIHTNRPAVNVCYSCNRYVCDKDSGCSKHFTYPVKEMRAYVAFQEQKREGETYIRRHPKTPGGPSSVEPRPFGCTTLYETFERATRLYADLPLYGTRTVNADGSIGPYSFRSYGEVRQRCEWLQSAMAKFKLCPRENYGLWFGNRPEFIEIEYAGYMQNLCSVPIYDTFGEEGCRYILEHASIRVLFASQNKWPLIETILQTNKHLTHVVLLSIQPFEPKQLFVPPFGSTVGNAKILSYADTLLIGQQLPLAPHSPPLPNDLFTISYTSGTTGNPKGVMLTHANNVANIWGGRGHANNLTQTLNSTYTHLCYLPLAHVMERLNVSAMIAVGVKIGFFRGNMLQIIDDAAALKPTLFAGPPRIFNRLYDAMNASVENLPPLNRAIFSYAMSVKLHRLHDKSLEGTDAQYQHPLWDRIVFRKFAEKLGGEVRVLVSGSAPISSNVKDFMRIVFSAPMLEGYGMTETASGGTLANGDNAQNGHVGSPFMSNEIKLVDLPDMGYTSTDMVDGVPMPRGEVCFRGHSIFAGYYKEPEKTAEVFTKDGWFRTGDVGLLLPNGALRIIDRAKQLLKLSQGEYVSPEKIEAIYGRSNFVQSIFVHGDSLQSSLVAIVIPDEQVLSQWAQKHHVKGKYDELCRSRDVKEVILKDFERLAREASLQGFEQVKDIYVDSLLWSPENVLTPKLSLKRNVAAQHYRKDIDAMYARLTSAVDTKQNSFRSNL